MPLNSFKFYKLITNGGIFIFYIKYIYRNKLYLIKYNLLLIYLLKCLQKYKYAFLLH